uniref:Glypican-2 n=2 Tax=Mesocestoides corti TaxID=53468 RepID=A0A5K3EZZ4_MESCO
MRTFQHLLRVFILFVLIYTLRCCKNPQETSYLLRMHLFGHTMQHQKFEDDDLVSFYPASRLQNCHISTENCCSVDAENIYLAFKFADDINAVSRIGIIRSQLDFSFPIFLKPFIQSIELSLSEIFDTGVKSQLPPHQIATSVSKLYSAIRSIISMPEQIDYLKATIKNVLLELKLISATQLTMLNPGLQHCLSNEAELLNFLEIVNSDSTDITAFKIQDELENNLVKYLQHFSFFIEILSTFEQQKLSESCAAGFEQLFFCRLCRSHNTSMTNTGEKDRVPQVIRLVGTPCPNRCLNVIRGCYAGLTGVVPQLSQLTKDFIDLSRLLAQVTFRPKHTGGGFLHYHFLEEMHAWSKKLQNLTQENWTSINQKVKKQCAGNPPVQNVDLTSPDWKAEVAEFLWDATEQAVRNYSRAHQSRTAAEIWTLSDARDESVFNKLRMEQQQSYVRMEQLIEQFMVPERLFGEHLGQTCLMGSSENCWNGHKFTDEYERVADFTRIGQMTNPAVKVTNAELGYFSTRLGAKMSARSQAIRTLLHKIRRRSTGEEEFLPMPVQPSSHLKHFTEEDDNLTFHPIAPPIDIDDEGLQANYLYEESSGLPIEYGGEWNSLLPDHPGTLGNFTFGSLDEASRVQPDLDVSLDVEPTTTTSAYRPRISLMQTLSTVLLSFAANRLLI